MPLDVQLAEEQRQAVLLAIAELALRRPGWDHMLEEIADLLHGREMFDGFKVTSAPSREPAPGSESEALR